MLGKQIFIILFFIISLLNFQKSTTVLAETSVEQIEEKVENEPESVEEQKEFKKDEAFADNSEQKPNEYIAQETLPSEQEQRDQRDSKAEKQEKKASKASIKQKTINKEQKRKAEKETIVLKNSELNENQPEEINKTLLPYVDDAEIKTPQSFASELQIKTKGSSSFIIGILAWCCIISGISVIVYLLFKQEKKRQNYLSYISPLKITEDVFLENDIY